MLGNIGDTKSENVDNSDRPRRILVRPPPKKKPFRARLGPAPKKKWGGGKVKYRRDLKAKRNFFSSPAWLSLRYDVLRKHGRNCMLCGILARPPHIDHIKPRSKFPELALDINNLQVLCHDCNMGKGNRDETDFRGAT